MMPIHNAAGVNMMSGEELINATRNNNSIKKEMLPIDLRLIRKDGAMLYSNKWICESSLKNY